jgi:hypothetical protein
MPSAPSFSNPYDFSKSDLSLMVGGQIMLLVMVILVLCFGVEPLHFAYKEQVQNIIRTNGS